MAEIAAGITTAEAPKSASLRTVVAASAAGTTFEWYDFFVFGSLTGVISKTFFSGLPETAGIAAALALFGAASRSGRSAPWCSAGSAIGWAVRGRSCSRSC